jgi:hypothetical protein
MVTAGAGSEAGSYVHRAPAPGRHQLQIPDSSSREGCRIALTVQGVLDDMAREGVAQVVGAASVHGVFDDMQASLERLDGSGEIGRIKALVRTRTKRCHAVIVGNPEPTGTYIC